jgi:hypothetical protein
MRFLWIVCCVLLLAAGAWRLHRSSAEIRANAEATPTAPSDSETPLRSSGPVAHQLDASAAVRAPRHADVQSAPAQQAAPARDVAASERTASSRSNTLHPQPATQSVDEVAPKPAGELFLPFIADDPSQVFAPSTVQYHAALQGEAQDAAWGPAAESALRGYFAPFGERFEIPYVDCRQDLCELQVASRSGGNLQQDMRDVQDALARMQHEAWWNALEFDQQSGTVASSPDGRVLALWFFSRK